jgi:hypothetical protein
MDSGKTPAAVILRSAYDERSGFRQAAAEPGFLASPGMTIFRVSENIQDIRDFVGNLGRVKDPFPPLVAAAGGR